MAEHGKRLAIVVGGGPAPGINGVISAATIRARLDGADVIGVQNGFSRIMEDDISRVVPLTIESVSRIHFEGGSVIGTARANPTKSPALLENVVKALLRLDVTQLITIGGAGEVSGSERVRGAVIWGEAIDVDGEGCDLGRGVAGFNDVPADADADLVKQGAGEGCMQFEDATGTDVVFDPNLDGWEIRSVQETESGKQQAHRANKCHDSSEAARGSSHLDKQDWRREALTDQ